VSKYFDPAFDVRPPKAKWTLEERYWSKVDWDDKKPDDCWEWLAYKDRNGYGKFIYEGCASTAQRFAYAWFYGPFRKELHVLHHCDNPGCQNPRHLFLGTQLDNNRDRQKKGRYDTQVRGARHHQHKLTTKDVLAIDVLLDKGVRVCHLAHAYNVTWTTINSIKTGRIWGHLTGRVQETSS
jgi:hypothetical protein